MKCSASLCGFKQITNKHTHPFENSSSHIDLLFKSPPKLVVRRPSVTTRILVYTKYDLKTHYLPPCEREI